MDSEIIKVYRNWCREHRYGINKCIMGYCKYGGNLAVWICLKKHVSFDTMLKSIRSINFEITCYASKRDLDVYPGEIVIFHDKSCEYYDALYQSGNIIND